MKILPNQFVDVLSSQDLSVNNNKIQSQNISSTPNLFDKPSSIGFKNDVDFFASQQKYLLHAQINVTNKSSNEVNSGNVIDESILFPLGIGLQLNKPDKPGSSPLVPANRLSTPEEVFKVLENSINKKPPFDIPKGEIKWFVSEGNPYTGTPPEQSVRLQVDLSTSTVEPIKYKEADLLAIYDRIKPQVRPVIEGQVREQKGVNSGILSKTALDTIEKRTHKQTEKLMWEEISRQVAKSHGGVAEVELTNSMFSRQGNGKFAVVRDPKQIAVQGGIPAILNSLEKVGVTPDSKLQQAANRAIARANLEGKVTAAFKYGGKVLVVVSVAQEAYAIAKAEDKLKQTIKSAAGLRCGAVAATAAGSALLASMPVNMAPIAGQIVAATGATIAGAIAYSACSEAAGATYDVLLELDSN